MVEYFVYNRKCIGSIPISLINIKILKKNLIFYMEDKFNGKTSVCRCCLMGVQISFFPLYKEKYLKTLKYYVKYTN